VPEARFISGRNYRLGSELGNQSERSEAPCSMERQMERHGELDGTPGVPARPSKFLWDGKTR